MRILGCGFAWIVVLSVVGLRAQVAVKLEPPLARGVAAFPQVQAGGEVTPEVAAKINAALVRLDKSAAAAALDCRNSFREQQHKSGADAWQRTVEVTMAGPRYLSLLATDSYYCGGPYPNDGILLPLVYDLTTGRPVDWVKLMPPGGEGGPEQLGRRDEDRCGDVADAQRVGPEERQRGVPGCLCAR